MWKKKKKRTQGGVTAQPPLPPQTLGVFFLIIVDGAFFNNVAFYTCRNTIGYDQHFVKKINGSVTEGVIWEWKKP